LRMDRNMPKKATNASFPFRSERAKSEYMDFLNARSMRWPIEYEERTVRTSFGDAYLRACGPAKGPPLLLMHGGGDNSSSWAPNIEALSRRHRCYAVDLINASTRSVRARPMNKMEDILRWMAETLDALGVEGKADVMGMSYGAHLSARFALAYPERVEKLVLIAPPNFAIPNSGEFVARVLLTMIPSRKILRDFFIWIFADLAREGGERGEELIELYVDNTQLSRRCFVLQKFINPTVFSEEELLGLSMPTLFMIGEHDINYPARKAIEQLEAAAPRIETELYGGVGHELPILRASEVDERALRFLAS
jgi:pimeloyl-ACP methyl ester carboxylesterase